MESLNINSTNLTPSVEFNPVEGKFYLGGYSRPEDVREFYAPLIQWINRYDKFLRKPEPGFNTTNLIFVFKFSYFNSATTKYLCDMIFEIVKLKKYVANLQIDWYYEEYDDDMREVGEALSDMVNYPFNFYSFMKD